MKTILIILFSISLGYSQTDSIRTDLVYKVNLPTRKLNKTPVIILLHGYGSNEEDLFGLANAFDNRFLTFSLRAPDNANGQGYCWYSLDFLPDKKFKYNYSQAQQSKAKIFSFISKACKVYKADSNQVFILGFSQGAILAYDMVLSRPEKIKGMVGLSGKILDESKKIKTDVNKLNAVKIFIGHGTMDNVIDFNEGLAAEKFLKHDKKNINFNSYEIVHTISGKELNDIKDWLSSKLEKLPEDKKRNPAKPE